MQPKSPFISAAGFGGNAVGEADLSARLVAVLAGKIRDRSIAPGTRLPTESEMAQHFAVSRTVIREVMVSLRAQGLIETRYGGHAWVSRPRQDFGFDVDPATNASIVKLYELLEVRRGIDPEVAALAAERRTGRHVNALRQAMARMAMDDASGGSGVEGDFQFHSTLAQATGNPSWVKLVESLAQQILDMIIVTRAHNARSAGFSTMVRGEHKRILDAVIAGDPQAARTAAIDHIDGAVARIAAADRDFWAKEGGEFGRRLIADG
jgi:DNA-binding FadR family transcriptional regulator